MRFKKLKVKTMKEKIKKYAAQVISTINDKSLYHYAASLSFHSVLALIPFLFISLSLFFQLPSFKEHSLAIQNFIASLLLPTNAEQFSSYLESFLSNSSHLGLMGVIAMIFTAVMFFTDFEYVITRLSASQPRSFFMRLSIFWTLLTLMPLGLAFSLWLSTFLNDFIKQLDIGINFFEILPYIIIWAIFGITYGVCINRKLLIKDIFLSSFLASIGWNISKLLFVSYAFYNKNYTSIYGSMSILLFFFLWLYVSWIVFLFGLKFLIKLSEVHDEQGV